MIVDYSSHYKRCDFYNNSNSGDPTLGQEKWKSMKMESESCSAGFSRFGTSLGCYRFVDDGSWSGNRDDAEVECQDYGNNVHLAG